MTTEPNCTELGIVTGKDLVRFRYVAETIDKPPVDRRSCFDAQLLGDDTLYELPVVVGVWTKCWLRVSADQFGEPHIVSSDMLDPNFQLFMPRHMIIVSPTLRGILET